MKVFCSECKHYRYIDWYGETHSDCRRCLATARREITVKEDYFERIEREIEVNVHSCYVRNAKNDCQYYEAKK